MDHSRDEGEDPRDQGGTRHDPSELWKKEHTLLSVGHRNEQVQQEEGRPTGVHQNPLADACDRERDHCPATEGMPSQDLRDHTTDSSRPHGFWSPQCPVIRGAVHDGARLCEMGAADSLRGPRRLPAVAPGEVVGEPPSRTNQRGQESSECKDSGSSEANSSSGICRIRQQLEVERGPDPDDPVSPRGGCCSPGGTPSQEDREARRTDDRGLLQGPFPLSTTERESPALSDRICQFQCTIDVSQGATWEPLPEHKARQLAFQSDDMLPEAFGSLVSEGRLKLLEVACSNESILTETMQRLTKDEMSARRCSLFNGFDLSTNAGVRKIIQVIDQTNPEHVWLSPICGPYSVMQQINQRTPKQCEELQEKRRDALRQYVGCALIYSYCIQKGIHVTWEWSQSCQGRRLPFMQKLVAKYNPFFAVVRGCQVGLVDKNDQFVSKGWKLMTTHSLLAQRMELPCKCPKHVEHVKCEGSVTSGTAFYPQGFATRVCQAIKKGCSRDEVRGELQGITTLLDAFGNGISCLCTEGQRHEANLTCGMCNHHQLGILRGNDHQSCPKGNHQHCDAVEAHPVGGTPKVHFQNAEGPRKHPHVATETQHMAPVSISPDEAIRTPMREQPSEHAHAAGDSLRAPLSAAEKEEVKRKLYLLHSATGHGPVRHLLQSLRRRGVDRQVLELAEQFECPVCVERKRPQPRPVSTLEPLPPKWSTVAADMGTWEHPVSGQTFQFLVVIDEGSRFRVGRVLGEGKKYHVGASQFLETFQECWSQYFGLPDTLRVDPDGTFRSNAIAEYCDRHKVFLDIIPGEAHWKLGTCENAVKGIKELMSKQALAEPDITVRDALSEAVRVFNEREMIRGYSPIQHALGPAPDASGRLFPRAGGDSPDLLVENANGEFHRNLERMKVAEQAFLDWNNEQRVQRALNSKGRTALDFLNQEILYMSGDNK